MQIARWPAQVQAGKHVAERIDVYFLAAGPAVVTVGGVQRRRRGGALVPRTQGHRRRLFRAALIRDLPQTRPVGGRGLDVHGRGVAATARADRCWFSAVSHNS